jgi:hypothetical protein
MGSEAPEPSKAAGSFVFLCHSPDVTLSEERLVGACLGSGAKEPPGISGLGLSSCVQTLLASIAGREPRAGPRGAVNREPKARGSPQALG